MAQEVIALWGIRVSSVERELSVRHTFAFDLRGVHLRARSVVSVSLELPASVTQNARSVTIGGRACPIQYEQADHAEGLLIGRVTLASDAIDDLENATGGFFSVDAEFDDSDGEPLCLGHPDDHRLALFALAEGAESARFRTAA